MKILSSAGLIVGICLLKTCQIHEINAILFASFIIVSNLVGLLSIVKEEIVKELKEKL